jgi:hypothetical protein
MGQFFGKGKEQGITKKQTLATVPHITPGLDYKTNKHELIEITLHRKESRTIKTFGKLVDIPDKKALVLDDIGSFVWNYIDGKKTVYEIILQFAKDKKLHRRESEIAIIEYMKRLAKRELIYFEVPEKTEEL